MMTTRIDLAKSSPESVLSGLTNNDLKNVDTDNKFDKETKQAIESIYKQ